MERQKRRSNKNITHTFRIESVDDLEKRPKLKARYESGVDLYMNGKNGRYFMFRSVAKELKLNERIFRAYVKKMYPEYKTQYDLQMVKVIDILADTRLQNIYDRAVGEYLTNIDVNLTTLSEQFGVDRQSLRSYVMHIAPDFRLKRKALMGNMPKKVAKILHDPKLRSKYDQLIERYLTNPSIKFSQLVATLQDCPRHVLQSYMDHTVPNNAQRRADLLLKSNLKLRKKTGEQQRTAKRKAEIQRLVEAARKRTGLDDTLQSEIQVESDDCYVLDTPEEEEEEESLESRIRQFEDQGLCHDEVKNRVTCTSCDVILVATDTESLARHCQLSQHMDARNKQRFLENTAEIEIDLINIPSPIQDPLAVTQVEAPKDSVGPGENSWAAQTSQAPMPSTSRAKEMSPRPSTSATHTGGFLIKQDPGTPPPVQQQVMNPYIQEPPMVQSAPRLLPKPSVPPPQSQVQQQPRLRVRQPQHVAPAPAPPDPDPEPQQVCLRWNSFHNNMQTMFPTLLNKEKFVDVTLACEGQTVKCHKVVLSSCSAYIERLLTENPCKHPIILMPNTMRYWQIRALVDFMYRGEVNVEHEQLSSLLAAAEFLQVKGLAGPPTSPEQNTNMEDPEPEPPLSPRPKRKRVASPSPVPQHRQPVATPPTPQPQQQQQQQQQRTSLPNSPAVSITRLKQSTAVAQATPSTSRDTGSRAQSPGIEITPVVSFEEIKMEPIDISDSNDESMDPNMHCDVDYDMDNGDGEGDKDYDDEDLDEDSGDAGRGAEDDTGGGGGDADPGPSLQPSTSDDQPGTSKTTSNGPDLTTPGFSGNGIEIDDSAASYCAADLGLTTEPPEDPPDSGAGNWKRLTKRWRCHYCPRKDDRKTTVRCIRCTNSICPNHRETMYQCGVCENKPIAETLDFPQETDFCHECPPGGNKVAARCITCFKSVCCMHRSEVPHCVKCPALEEQESEKSS